MTAQVERLHARCETPPVCFETGEACQGDVYGVDQQTEWLQVRSPLQVQQFVVQCRFSFSLDHPLATQEFQYAPAGSAQLCGITF